MKSISLYGYAAVLIFLFNSYSCASTINFQKMMHELLKNTLLISNIVHKYISFMSCLEYFINSTLKNFDVIEINYYYNQNNQ